MDVKVNALDVTYPVRVVEVTGDVVNTDSVQRPLGADLGASPTIRDAIALERESISEAEIERVSQRVAKRFVNLVQEKRDAGEAYTRRGVFREAVNELGESEISRRLLLEEEGIARKLSGGKLGVSGITRLIAKELRRKARR